MILLNWNGKNDTIECLKSLYNIKYPNFSILLIDNGSTDDSVKMIEKIYPNLDILKLKKNYGFAKGINKGIFYLHKDRPDYIVIMNNTI